MGARMLDHRVKMVEGRVGIWRKDEGVWEFVFAGGDGMLYVFGSAKLS